MRDLKQYFRDRDRSYFGLLFNRHFENSFNAIKLKAELEIPYPTSKVQIQPLTKEKGKF